MSVSNTGPVIPPDQIDRLLKPFQRLGTDHADGSVGLGLSIVAAIAAAHEADLSAHPQAHGGLDVQVTFPAHRPTASEPGERPPTDLVLQGSPMPMS